MALPLVPLIGAAVTAILSKIVGFAAWLGLLAVAMFAAFWLLGTDLGAWIFEQVLTIAIAALDSIPWNAEVFNPGSYISALPPEVTNIMGLLRLGECVAIIAAAVILKIILQLIPFTRLGS